MRIYFAAILFVVAAAGCGGKSKSEMSDPCKGKHMGSGEGEREEHEEGKEHAMMTPEMTAFHDVLAPLWHAEAGPTREADTCAAGGKMLDLGSGIQDAMLPEGVTGADWDEGVKILMLAIVDLMDTCSGSETGHTFDQAFGGLHDGFHGLLDQLPKE